MNIIWHSKNSSCDHWLVLRRGGRSGCGERNESACAERWTDLVLAGDDGSGAERRTDLVLVRSGGIGRRFWSEARDGSGA